MRFAFNPFTDKLDITGQGPGVTSVDFLTGNSGGAVAADAAFNINVIGDNTSGINTIGNLSPNTLTIFGLASTTTQIGTTRYATNAEAAAQTIGTASLTPANITSFFSTHFLPSSQGGTGLSSPAAHQLIVTNGSSAYTPLGVASNGQIPIGSIGSDPVLANITSSGGTITVTNGPGSINLDLSGGSVGVDSFSPDSGTDPVFPTVAGLVNDKGSGSITTVGSLNTITTQLTGLTNHSVLVGAGTTTITKLSVGSNGQVLVGATAADPAFATLTSSDSSISFTTGANTLSLQVAGGTSVVKTLTGNSGGALSPTAGNISTLGTGSITIAGSGSTLTTQLTGLTNHNVLIGAGSATITNVAPSSTSGVPLISQGSSSDPVFGTAVVAGGGTGATSFTAYAPVCGGTTTTGALQSASTGISTSGFVLTSNGNAALPSFQASTSSGFTQVVSQVFTSNGTYTPTANMKYCIVEVVGGGGGSAGVASAPSTQVSIGGSGGGGGYARIVLSAATVGASQTVTIGAGGTAGASGANSGGNGGTTSVGSLCVATGGIGGATSGPFAAVFLAAPGSAGGVGTTGDLLINGAGAGCGSGSGTTNNIAPAAGGNSYFGGGAQAGGSNTGFAGTAYGGGASGGGSVLGNGPFTGSAGFAGVVIVTEYI